MYYLRLAIHWGRTIEEKVLNELASVSTPLDRIKEYQVMAESKITLLVQLSHEEQAKDLHHSLSQLTRRIENDMKHLSASPSTTLDNQPHLEQMANLLSYLGKYTSSSSSSWNSSVKEEVNKLATDVYQLLDRMVRLSEESTELEYQAVKREIHTLTKGLATVRNRLEKEIAENKNVEENKASVDHVEDLQENMADWR